jgi:hypothetical protein
MREANQNNIDKRYGFQIVENRSTEPLHAAAQAAQIIGTNRQYVCDGKAVALEVERVLGEAARERERERKTQPRNFTSQLLTNQRFEKSITEMSSSAVALEVERVFGEAARERMLAAQNNDAGRAAFQRIEKLGDAPIHAAALEVERVFGEAARERQREAGVFGVEGGRGNEKPLVKSLTKGFSDDRNDGKAVALEVERVLGEAAQEQMRQANQNNIDKRYSSQIFDYRSEAFGKAAAQAAQIIGANRYCRVEFSTAGQGREHGRARATVRGG